MKEKNNKWAQIGLLIGLVSIFFAPIGIIPLSGLVVNSIAVFKATSCDGNGKWIATVNNLYFSLS